MDPFIPWFLARLRARLDLRGQAELIVIALVVLLIWLLITGRKVVVQ